jgi:two-component system alkaline phosphatase synthesis response regulator PhoP
MFSFEIEDRPIYSYNSLVVDLNTYVVNYDGKSFNLPTRAFELLAFLASKPGVVLTKSQILNAVWGTEIIVDDKTITVHVSTLKKLLGEPNLIVTIKGKGYKLNPDIK